MFRFVFRQSSVKTKEGGRSARRAVALRRTIR
jgi:hypothetical protein